MAKCPSCGAIVTTSDKRCSKCGAKLDNKNKSSSKLIIGIVVVVAILALVGAFASGVFNGSDATTDVADQASSQSAAPVEEPTTTTDDVDTSSQSASSDDESSSSSSEYWASAKSDKFHDPSCEWAQKISSKNKIVYDSREDAIADGKVPCSVCNP